MLKYVYLDPNIIQSL